MFQKIFKFFTGREYWSSKRMNEAMFLDSTYESSSRFSDIRKESMEGILGHCKFLQESNKDEDDCFNEEQINHMCSSWGFCTTLKLVGKEWQISYYSDIIGQGISLNLAFIRTIEYFLAVPFTAGIATREF